MAHSLYMIDFNGHKDTDFFVKNGKRFKKATDIGVKAFVYGDTIALKYKVDGKVYDTLFVKSDDGKSMVNASELDERLCYHIADGMGATVDCEVDGNMLYFRNDPLACSFDEAVSTDFAEVVADWADFKGKVQLKGV